MSSKPTPQASHHRGVILHYTGWLLLVFVLAIPLLSFSEGSLELAAAVGSTVLPLGVLASIAIALGERFPPRHWPRCEITDDGGRIRVVELRGSRRFRRGSLPKGGLVGGLVLPPHGNWPVVIELEAKNGSKLRIIDETKKKKRKDAKHDADAQWKNAWLRRYQLDAAQAPTRASLGSPIPFILWAGLVASVLVFSSLGSLHRIAHDLAAGGLLAVPWTILVAAISVIAARRLAPHRVVVGSDGVTTQRAFGRSFVPHADVEVVEFHGRAGLRIRTCQNRAVRAGWLLGVARRDALHALMEAWHRRGTDLSPRLEALRRNGRAVNEWLDALASVTTAAGYRANAPTPDQLLAAVDNPIAPVELRLGATVALSKAGKLGPPGLERLRAAAATSASPRIAKALEALAAGTIDATTIEAALSEGAAVQSGVHTAQRHLQSQPSPAAQRDAAPEGTKVVKTHMDSFMLAIIGLPIFPILLVGIPAALDGKTDEVIGMVALSVVWLPYFIAWIVSRARSERRFVFHPDRVWLPGFYHRIRGRYVAYQDIAQLGGDSEHFHILMKSGGRRTYDGNVVDFRELEKVFKRFRVKSAR